MVISLHFEQFVHIREHHLKGIFISVELLSCEMKINFFGNSFYLRSKYKFIVSNSFRLMKERKRVSIFLVLCRNHCRLLSVIRSLFSTLSLAIRHA